MGRRSGACMRKCVMRVACHVPSAYVCVLRRLALRGGCLPAYLDAPTWRPQRIHATQWSHRSCTIALVSVFGEFWLAHITLILFSAGTLSADVDDASFRGLATLQLPERKWGSWPGLEAHHQRRRSIMGVATRALPHLRQTQATRLAQVIEKRLGFMVAFVCEAWAAHNKQCIPKPTLCVTPRHMR